MAFSAPAPAAIRAHIISVIQPNKLTIKAPKMESMRTPEPVKVAEINPLKKMAKLLAVIPKAAKQPAGTKFAG